MLASLEFRGHEGHYPMRDQHTCMHACRGANHIEGQAEEVIAGEAEITSKGGSRCP